MTPLACEHALVISAKESVFFRPQEDLRRVEERFTESLALFKSLLDPFRPLADWCCPGLLLYRRRKNLCRRTKSGSLFTSYDLLP